MVKVIFVCLGNICRSPAAEGIFSTKVKERGLEEDILVDSAGTHAYHVGDPADARMQRHASKRGYKLLSIGRAFDPSDLKEYDYILAMDRENYANIISLDSNGQFSGKVKMMTDYNRKVQAYEVPDPYYGGPQGFERVLDIIEEASENLLDEISEKHNLTSK